MPTISLRLTDEEHAALKDWAHGSHRSMQREAVYRIFAGLTERGTASPVPDVKSEDLTRVPRSVSPDVHFKPDFK